MTLTKCWTDSTAIWLVASALTAVAAAAQPSERTRAEITCKPAGQAVTYDCTMKLAGARTGVAVAQAEVVVRADMPSMPMMHEVAPVKATPTEVAGQYRFALKLDMHGDWALQVTIEKPVRDRLVEVLSFSERDVTSARLRRNSPKR